MDQDGITVIDKAYRAPEAKRMQATISEESKRKLAEAAKREQARLDKETFFDRIMNAIFKVKKKSSEADMAKMKNQSNER